MDESSSIPIFIGRARYGGSHRDTCYRGILMVGMGEKDAYVGNEAWQPKRHMKARQICSTYVMAV